MISGSEFGILRGERWRSPSGSQHRFWVGLAALWGIAGETGQVNISAGHLLECLEQSRTVDSSGVSGVLHWVSICMGKAVLLFYSSLPDVLLQRWEMLL